MEPALNEPVIKPCPCGAHILSPTSMEPALNEPVILQMTGIDSFFDATSMEPALNEPVIRSKASQQAATSRLQWSRP